MEEKELKNENNTTVTLDSLEISKREDEDATLAAHHNGDKEIQGVKSISLGKSLLGDNALKKGISVSVRGRNAGSVLNLKNGGSVWKKKDEKGPENQREEIGKKIDEESFPDLLESTEKIKSELAKDKDKKKKGGKDLKKQDDVSFRCGSEKGRGGEIVSGEKRRHFTNNLEASQNNDSGLKKWSDQANENETIDVKDNERAADEKQDPESVGYLMPGFKGKHMIGFYCFLKKGSQNPPPLPPKVPFDDTSFFEIIEKQKNLMTKPLMVPVINASQQMAQLGQGNQMSQVMQTPPVANVQSTNCVNNSNMGMGGGGNQNQMNQVNKINAFNPNEKVMRKQQDAGQNRFMQNPQIASLSRSNLNMFDENVNNTSGNNNNNNNSINNVSRSNNYQQRGGRNIGQNNMNYNMNNTNDMLKNNVPSNANNFIKGSSNAGSPNMGGNVRQRNFNRRNEKKDDKKVKIADIDADTNWRSPLNKKTDDEKTAGMSNDMWNGSVDNNVNSMNYSNDNSSNNNNNISNNNNNNNNYNNNNNNMYNNNVGNDRMKRGFRNRNTNPAGNMSSVGSASSFNRNNFNANRSFFNRNNANNNMMNRNNLHKNNNMNSGNNSFINNNNNNNNNNNSNMQMNVVRNNMYRGNGNRNNASALNNSNYANYNNMGNNKNMNRNYVKRNNVGNAQNFGNNDSGNNGGVLANNLFNRLSGNMFQNTSLAPATASHTSSSNRRAANIEQDISANMSSGAVATDRGNDLNVEIGNN